MAGSARAPRVCDPRKVQTWHWSRLGLFGVLLAEFRRAVAAEQRYEHLKRASAACLARDGIAPADIPRRIFEEFYSLSAKPRSEAPSTALGANLLLESDCLSAVRSDQTDSTRISTLAPTFAPTHARYR
jgi:hypothetical protein